MRYSCLIAFVFLALLPACEDDPVSPSAQRITVKTVTTGDGTDADGFIVNLDSGAVTSGISLNSWLAFVKVEPGNHDVLLEDLADNCSVDGANPQSVAVVAGQAVEVTFNVTCVEEA